MIANSSQELGSIQSKRCSQEVLNEARLDFDEPLHDRSSSNDDIEFQRLDSFKTKSYISEHDTMNDHSHYCKFRKRQLKNLSKILGKEVITKANKKAMQHLLNMQEETNEIRNRKEIPSRRHVGNVAELLLNIDLSWVSTSERFRHFTR